MILQIYDPRFRATKQLAKNKEKKPPCRMLFLAGGIKWRQEYLE